MEKIKHVILVLSGKGGVGKSTVALQLALTLNKNQYKVGILDIDLCGPSIPRMMNLSDKTIYQCSQGWVPVYVDDQKTLCVMSMAFLLPSDKDPVIWRGPKKNAMIKQFINNVYWEELDYLIIDTPPGTSDEHISVIENIAPYNPEGAILITTPQLISVNDVRREITFCRKLKIPILGLFENMSGYICPHCKECSDIFSQGGGQKLAEYANIPFLGSIPLDPNIALCSESGENFIEKFRESSSLNCIFEFISKLNKSELN
ncbi:unnamed protein product [Gordionus sp. m RMFG-2023]|uniref:cytosolic Fe-S cluster assembly factor NUBP2 homolog n=1 Tax=Gordionus sp. m RMFG-2023 TaxID=3053472 RepID=UPI0030E16D5B